MSPAKTLPCSAANGSTSAAEAAAKVGGKLIGVDIEGAYYPLHGAELVPDFPLGVSNEFVEPTVTLRCQAGHGIVVLTRAD